MSLIETIKQRARLNRKRIVLPEGSDPRVAKAAGMILNEGIADVILVGNRDEILRSSGGEDIPGAEFVEPLKSDSFESYVQALYELRKNKGLSIEQARDLLKDPVYFGTMMVKQDHADGLVSGAIHSTADTLRPALQIIKTSPGVELVSSFFFMVSPDERYGEDGLLVYADCGLNENPDSAQLAEIAVSSARTLKNMFGITPRVAMLSYSTFGSARSELTEKVIRAVELAKLKAPDIMVEGEMQVDAALIPRIAELKAPGSRIAGRANVLIFPDLNSGNIAYKLTERLAKAEAYGPITQGLAKPVNDLSRGCKAEDIVGVAAITAIQAAAL